MKPRGSQLLYLLEPDCLYRPHACIRRNTRDNCLGVGASDVFGQGEVGFVMLGIKVSDIIPDFTPLCYILARLFASAVKVDYKLCFASFSVKNGIIFFVVFLCPFGLWRTPCLRS